jgi:hypothetical protein
MENIGIVIYMIPRYYVRHLKWPGRVRTSLESWPRKWPSRSWASQQVTWTEASGGKVWLPSSREDHTRSLVAGQNHWRIGGSRPTI